MKRGLASVLILIAAGTIIYALLYLFEGAAPVVDAVLPSDYLKKGYEMSITLSDLKTGLQRIMVIISQQGKETTLIDKKYESPGLLGMFFGPKIVTDSFMVPIDALKYGIKDGEVVITITASDNSLQGWGKGHNVKGNYLPGKRRPLGRGASLLSKHLGKEDTQLIEPQQGKSHNDL